MPAPEPHQRQGALLVVGPKRSIFTHKELSTLQSTITNDEDLAFLPEVIYELESLWPMIAESHSSFKTVDGRRSLHDLGQFLKNGELNHLTQTDTRRDNILLDVVTVLSHVVDFWRLATTKVQNNLLGPRYSQISENRLDDIQGFCLGFLTAAAVAGAKDRASLATNVRTILRIAVCIGTVVEVDASKLENSGAQAISLSVGWNSESQFKKLHEVLNDYTSAYVACTTDAARVTITISSDQVDLIAQDFSALGLSVRHISLEGRYHCPFAHKNGVQSLKRLFEQDARFQLPNAASLTLPVRSNVDGRIIKQGALHDIALESILLQQCRWFDTVKHAATHNGVQTKKIVRLDPEAIVPYSLSKAASLLSPPLEISDISIGPESSVAIVGMSCRYPQADSLEEFWELLLSGSSAVQPVPQDRFQVSDLTREPIPGTFWGNFLRNPDLFDHRFFNLSGREAKYMDPQQRLALQVGYEALESAGYFGLAASPESFASDIGCYIGVGSVDYGDNVASHDATAFSALGTLRAFISGRISHHFGWSGPSITYDTACSSGAVAIHSAVMAIRNGECSAALAGGVNVITSPSLFQNLAAASFLSPTGASKAFDANADGYCRGEGAGFVLLKPLARARADQDSILAVISGSAVNQGANCSPITVPVSESQSSLYEKALAISATDPRDVGFVEAHGTGTPVGDPIECESIRRTFGGSDRAQELFIGSVKDNIGHTEGASGPAALIKAVLMIQKCAIPGQAGFVNLNPKISPLEPDRISVPRHTQRWLAPRRIAVVNNYGAAGSNAALVVQDADIADAALNPKTSALTTEFSALPFFASARSPQSLEDFCLSLRTCIPKMMEAYGSSWMKNLAFNLSVKQNRAFEYQYSFTASDIDDLSFRLEDVQSRALDKSKHERRRVVLCVGCQTGRRVCLDETLFHNSQIFQKHLNSCDQICKLLGLPSLYPDIFNSEPINDLVCLHSRLFSMQYASAMAWLDSGLVVDAIIGHSFGQLTALVIAEALSLEDGLRLITERARLIQSLWGNETGEMLSIQGERAAVHPILERTRSKNPTMAIEICCYNGPEEVVLAGEKAAIDAVYDECRASAAGSEDIKIVRLKNTHAFHSSLIDGILPRLREIAATLQFRAPKMYFEACSKDQNWNEKIDAEAIVQHSRKPVHFNTAIQRVGTQLGPCVFLEAGAASPVVSMARRALIKNDGADAPHIFQSIDISAPNSLERLAKATCNLWSCNVHVQYWPFHRSQRDIFAWMNLPPYQFQRSSHWMDFIPASVESQKSKPATTEGKQPYSPQLLELQERSSPNGFIFSVNTKHEMYQHCTKGHAVLGQSLCPASMYLEMVIRAANLINDRAIYPSSPCVKSLKISAPLSLSTDSHVLLELTPIQENLNGWTFRVLSRNQSDEHSSIKHATGSVVLLAPSTYLEGARMQFVRRIIGQSKYEELTNAPGVHILNGNIIYQVFGQVVDYAPYYRGVTNIVSKNNEAIGTIVVPVEQSSATRDNSCDPVTLDNFLQVAGIHVNCLSERNTSEVFVCIELGEMFISDTFLSKRGEHSSYRVYTSYEQNEKKTLVNDIFVFDLDTGELNVLFLGATFQCVPIKTLARTLEKLNRDLETVSTRKQGTERLYAPEKFYQKKQPTVKIQGMEPQLQQNRLRSEASMKNNIVDRSSNSTLHQIRELFSRVVEIPLEDVKPSTTLSELGIDSLMSAEIITEIKNHFESAMISSEKLLSLDDVQSVAKSLEAMKVRSDASFSLAQQEKVATSPGPMVNGDQGRIPPSFVQIQRLLSNILGISASEIAADSSLIDLGVDSLMATEILGEIKKEFGVTISSREFRDFKDVLEIAIRLAGPSGMFSFPLPLDDESNDAQTNIFANGVSGSAGYEADSNFADCSTSAILDSFALAKRRFDAVYPEVMFADFYSKVYPAQMDLVVTYVVEAFREIGCDLAASRPGDLVQNISVLQKHHKVKRRLYEILEDANIIKQGSAGAFLRTITPVPTKPSFELHRAIVDKFPQHAFEHHLLASTGSKLADCLTGRVDPLAILFGNSAARTLMENVYTHAPMFKAGTINLAIYLTEVLTRFPRSRTVRILELGAGTGGTTKLLMDSLLTTGRDFEYTFTDLSSSLVAAARRKFATHGFMRYAVLNIEQQPASQFCGQYDIVISTNCIHATKDLVRSCTNIRAYLRPEGVLCLVELTRNLFWFDLVFGLLEGWWLFEDGRQHALASENLWHKQLTQAGFQWIDWTEGSSRESDVLRIITASPSNFSPSMPNAVADVMTMETVGFKRAGDIALEADIYYPEHQTTGIQARPVALMIHGGGHLMLSRKDVRPQQTQLLLAAGFLPISIDYRLCPETTLQSGPMADVSDALAWVRGTLPRLQLNRCDIRPDGDRVVAIGWSTGGHLALTLGFTAHLNGIAPPNAILAFYSPSDYEDPFWKRPNCPFDQGRNDLKYDVLDGVQSHPIVAYNPPSNTSTIGGWMNTSDLRSRIALHMNWTGTHLKVLHNGLSPGKSRNLPLLASADPIELLPEPNQEQIQAISPLAQIRQGKYHVPTFIIHGNRDDLIPWQQAVRTYEALVANGVRAEIRILDGAPHLFDLYRKYEKDEGVKKAISEAYEMLARSIS